MKKVVASVMTGACFLTGCTSPEFRGSDISDHRLNSEQVRLVKNIASLCLGDAMTNVGFYFRRHTAGDVSWLSITESRDNGTTYLMSVKATEVPNVIDVNSVLGAMSSGELQLVSWDNHGAEGLSDGTVVWDGPSPVMKSSDDPEVVLSLMCEAAK